MDYQSGKELRDVSIVLTEEELRDLSAYIQKLDHDPHVSCAYLSQFTGPNLISELTLAIGPRLGHQLAS